MHYSQASRQRNEERIVRCGKSGQFSAWKCGRSRREKTYSLNAVCKLRNRITTCYKSCCIGHCIKEAYLWGKYIAARLLFFITLQLSIHWHYLLFVFFAKRLYITYIYIYIYIVITTCVLKFIYGWRDSPLVGHVFLIREVSRSHTRHATVSRTPLGEWSARRRDLYLTTHNSHDRYPWVGGIRTHDHNRRAAEDLRLRTSDHRDRHYVPSDRLILFSALN
jgi:hypothetical protein